MHLYSFQKSKFKFIHVGLTRPTMQGSVEDAIYVFQGGITISTEGMLRIIVAR